MNLYSHLATVPRHPAIRFKDKSERSVLLLPCKYCVEFCHSFGFGTIAVSGDSSDSFDFLVVVPLQTSVIRFAHAPFTVLLSCSRVCPVLHLSSPVQTTLSTLHECNIITWRDIHDHNYFHFVYDVETVVTTQLSFSWLPHQQSHMRKPLVWSFWRHRQLMKDRSSVSGRITGHGTFVSFGAFQLGTLRFLRQPSIETSNST